MGSVKLNSVHNLVALVVLKGAALGFEVIAEPNGSQMSPKMPDEAVESLGFYVKYDCKYPLNSQY